MASASAFRATYTQDGHKKLANNRKWKDGFVTQQGRDAKLYDEGGSVVAVGRLPPGEVFEEGAELAKAFGQSIIVTLDESCSVIHISGGGSSEPAAPARPAAAAPACEPRGAATAAKPQLAVPVLRATGPGKRPAFKAPRPFPAAAVPAPRAPPPQAFADAAPLQHPQQRRQFMPPPPSKPSLPPPGIQQKPAPILRSDEDILRLLMGQPPLHGTPGGVPAAAAAGEPAAKRQRVQPPDFAAGGRAGAGLAAVAAAERAAPAAEKPKWNSFMSDDEEDLDLMLQHPPMEAAAAAASVQGAAASQRRHEWQRQPPLRAAPAGEQTAAGGAAWQGVQQHPGGHGAAQAAGQAAAGVDALDLSPSNSEGTAGSFRPIVRPLLARGPVAPPSWQQSVVPQPQPPQQAALAQQGWQVQRAPLQPTRQVQQPVRLGAATAAPPRKLAAPIAAAAPAAPGAAGGGAAACPPGARGAAAASRGWNSVLGGVVQLGFPTADECAKPARRVVIPDSFSSSQHYVQAWSNALLEELNLRTAEVAQGFHTAVTRAGQQQQPQRQPQLGQGGKKAGGASFGRGNSGGGAGGGGGLEACLRQCRVVYSGNCELFIWKNLSKKGNWNGKRDKRSQEDDVEDGEEAAKKPDSCYLILKSGRQKSADYRRDDLWILSNTAEFRSGFKSGQLGDRSRMPWVAVARSLWHGPNQDGKFEIEFLSARPPGLGRSQAVHAIKGPDASTEMAMMELLRSGAAATLPLLPHLLRTKGSGGSSSSSRTPAQLPGSGSGAGQQPEQLLLAAEEPDSPCYSCSDDDDTQAAAAAVAAAAADGLVKSPLMQADAISRHFSLNEEQSEVMQYVASWCHLAAAGGSGSGSKAAGSAAVGPPPVCLVHGPFGSGKSTLLVALLHFLLQQRGRQGSPLAGARMLISAHTNVAVDRVLEGLLDSGCTDFLRVGPLRRVSRRLLAQSLHASESRATASAAAELREMLKDANGPAELAVIQAELAAAEKGADRQRKRLLKTIPIVGVTCCSSMLAALDGQQFDVVILDECSQMVEPLSVVPLMRAKARYLIAAGDPLQLPPVVANPAHVFAAAAAPAAARSQQQQPRQQLHGLLRPLFVRLAALGLPPFLLRRQYRCHPDISAVPNQQFYGGRLLDGCSREERASLLPGLPSLVFLDVRGQEQYNAGRSTSNQQEAEAVVAAVERLVAAGVRLGQCGVICFYRAQVALVRSLLDRRMPQLEQQQERRQAAAALAGGGGDGGGGSSSCEAEGAALAAAVIAGEGGGEGGAGGGSNDEQQEDEQQQGIQVATVDSFQGAERDVIILTTAITRPGAFASDACRLNVALTRAKRNLLIVGCAPALQQAAPAFAALLVRCRGTPGGYSPSGRLPAGGSSGGGNFLATGQQAVQRQAGAHGMHTAAAAAAAAEGEDGCWEEDEEAAAAAAAAAHDGWHQLRQQQHMPQTQAEQQQPQAQQQAPLPEGNNLEPCHDPAAQLSAESTGPKETAAAAGADPAAAAAAAGRSAAEGAVESAEPKLEADSAPSFDLL